MSNRQVYDDDSSYLSICATVAVITLVIIGSMLCSSPKYVRNDAMHERALGTINRIRLAIEDQHHSVASFVKKLETVDNNKKSWVLWQEVFRTSDSVVLRSDWEETYEIQGRTLAQALEITPTELNRIAVPVMYHTDEASLAVLFLPCFVSDNAESPDERNPPIMSLYPLKPPLLVGGDGFLELQLCKGLVPLDKVIEATRRLQLPSIYIMRLNGEREAIRVSQ